MQETLAELKSSIKSNFQDTIGESKRKIGRRSYGIGLFITISSFSKARKVDD